MRAVVFLVTIFLSSFYTHAQVSFGPKIGVGFASQKVKSEISSLYTTNYKTIISPSIGFILNLKAGKYVSIQPSLQYTQLGVVKEMKEGSIGSIPLTFETYTKTLKINYVQLPVLINGEISLGNKITIGIGLGPYISYSFGGKLIDTHYTYKVKVKNEYDYAADGTNFVKGIDYGFVISPFINFNFVNYHFQLSPIYFHGLADVNPKEVHEKVHDKHTNYGYGLSIAFLIAGSDSK